MVWTPGKLLTPCLEFTPKSWDFVKHFIQDIGLNGTTKEVARGHIQYNNFMSLE